MRSSDSLPICTPTALLVCIVASPVTVDVMGTLEWIEQYSRIKPLKTHNSLRLLTSYCIANRSQKFTFQDKTGRMKPTFLQSLQYQHIWIKLDLKSTQMSR